MSIEDTDTDSEITAKHVLDARGLYCPEPVMMLHNKIREIEVGEILELKATDPSTTRDVPKFCIYLDHELLKEEQQGDLFLYWIQKKPER